MSRQRRKRTSAPSRLEPARLRAKNLCGIDKYCYPNRAAARSDAELRRLGYEVQS
jgi:hypothetical protein